MKTFARRVIVPVNDASTLLLFHGSPDSNNCDLLTETPAAELAEHLVGHAATVMAGGHTHIQMLRQHRGELLVNPGSVGLPFEQFVAGGPPTVLAHAEYAIVEFRGSDVAVDLRRLDLDRALLAEAARRWRGPLAPYLAAQYAPRVERFPRASDWVAFRCLGSTGPVGRQEGAPIPCRSTSSLVPSCVRVTLRQPVGARAA